MGLARYCRFSSLSSRKIQKEGSEPHSNQRTTGIDPHARNGHVEKIDVDLQTLTTNHYAINIQANQGNQQIEEIVKLNSD